MRMKIAIIGAGSMGGAIARGLAKVADDGGYDITVSNPSQGKLDRLKAECPTVSVTADNRQAASGAGVLVLAVKPWFVPAVLREVSPSEGQLLVSVAAGVTLADLASFSGGKALPIYRAVPNIAVAGLQGMTVLSAHGTTPAQDSLVLGLFGRLGLAMMLAEDRIAAATSLMSCGTAYAMKYIQAAMQAGIELGIPQKDAMLMVSQTLKGAADIILDNDTHPAVEIDRVCTPGGLTIRGINSLEHDGFASAIINAVKASMH